MDRLLQDVRYAVRALARTPGFTTVALLTLALGVGANTAIFSIVNGVILRPLGYPKPEQLLYLTTHFDGPGFEEFWVSPPEYMEFRELQRSLAAVGAYTTGEVNLTAGDRPQRARSAFVDDHLFRALAITPAQGRFFAPGEADVRGPVPVPPAPPLLPAAVAVLSHELWQTAFGGRPLIGETIEVDGLRREVIGIMPPGADVMDNRTEIWLPLGLNQTNRQNRGNHYLYLVGRLRDGLTISDAQAELRTLVANWADRTGLTQGPQMHIFQPPNAQGGGHRLQMEPMQGQILGTAGRSIWVLQAAVGLVLLIACANLANLLLARAESRHREFAVRSAIGATRARLLRQFMTEGVVLSLAGAALGFWLARAGVRLVMAAYPAALPRTSDVAVDVPVLLFTLGVAVATGIVFGFAPLLHTRVKGLAASLKDGGARGATLSARHRVRHGLVVAEVAFAVMLVIGAGLLVRTVYNLTNVDAGFDRARLITFSITLPRATYPRPSQRMQMFDRVLDSLRGVPGVQAASAMTGLPPRRDVNANTTEISNYTNGRAPRGPFNEVDYYQFVTSDYFETMGIPIVQGRGFQESDLASPEMVTVVNESLANTYWKGQNPIGQRLRQCCGDQVPWRTVIGVARDVKQGGIDQKTGTEMYFYVDEAVSVVPPRGAVPETMNVVLRTTLAPAALTPTIERAMKEADAAVPVVRLREMDAVFDEAIRRQRLLAQLIAIFGAIALALAAIGTYGVLSYMVAERRREIGIRLALGAERAGVVAQVMRQGLALTSVGILVGAAGALGVGRLLTSLLFGVQATDATTLVAVITTITVVATVACGFPAWRASRLDPNVVLRED